MTISVDATGTVSTSSGGTSFNYTGLTVGAALSNGALLIFVKWASAITSPTCTWNSVSMTLIQSFQVNSRTIAVFGLVNPASGNKTAALSWTGTAGAFAVCGQSYTGVNQTGGVTTWPNATTNNGVGAAVSVTVTSASGHHPTALLSGANSLSAAGFSGTIIFNNSTSHAGAEYDNGAASVTLSTTMTSGTWEAIGFDMVNSISGLPTGQNLYDIGALLPPSRLWPSYYRSEERFYNLNLIGKDKLPNIQKDWPNPRAYLRIDETWLWSTSPFNLLSPFNQLDWPLSGRYPRPEETLTEWYNLNLIGQDLLPFNQDDWPNPKANPRLDETWIWNTFISNYPIVVVQTPFNQLDWPNPQRISWDRFWTSNMGPGFLIAPFRQLDWPLPRPYPRLDQSWIFLPLSEEELGQSPFNQLDWPIPSGWRAVRLDYFGSEGPQEIIVLLPEVHFKPFMSSMGRMGHLGGLS